MKVNYEAPPTGAKFMQSNDGVRMIMGPVGCVAPNTQVITEFGPLPIARVDRPMRVLSWNALTCRFELALCGGAFPKGAGYLYRVTTSQGEFVAAGHHLLLCADGTYQRVESLVQGQSVSLCSLPPQGSELERVPPTSHSDDAGSMRTTANWMGHCAELNRLCGQQLLREEGIDLAWLLAPDGAQESTLSPAWFACAHTGDLEGPLPERIRPTLFDAPTQIGGCLPPGEPLQEAEEGLGVSGFLTRTGALRLVAALSQRWSAFRQKAQSVFSSSRSYSTSISYGTIIAVERESCKRSFWDMQVLDTNNYVTVDGAIHHNSGKSVTSIMEIFRRCAEMPKCKDGFRRSRWAVIRNTSQQLRDTTLKTWFNWFPDGVAGTWRVGDKVFLINVGDIRAEILFLPLDTPDDQRKLLSLELTGVFINEAREVHPEIIIAARSRLTRYPSKSMLPIDPATGKPVPYWSGLIMDTNPPSEDSWLYEQFEVLKPKGWSLYRQPSGLSPQAENRENLGATYYEDMMTGATEDFIRVHVHGEYGRSLVGRPVYDKSFVREYHTAPEVLRHIEYDQYPIIIGMDFGRTPSAVMMQRDARGRVLVLDALYVENIGLEGFLQQYLKPLLARRFPANRYLVCGDPAGWARSQLSEETVEDVFKREGLRSVRAPTNDPTKRIAAVEKLLGSQVNGAAALLFSAPETSDGMKHLVQAMYGGYKYRRKKDGSYETEPLKDEFSHVSDALQYGCLCIDSGGLAAAFGAKRRAVAVAPSGGWT